MKDRDVGNTKCYLLTSNRELLRIRASLLPVYRGRSLGTGLDVVLHVRGRQNVDIPKSYYLLVWSEWDFFHGSVIDAMETSMKEDFGGIGM